MTSVVPWRCHVCGRTFAEREGGGCARCGRRACPTHLVRLSGSAAKEDLLMACVGCVKPEEQPTNQGKKCS